MGYFSKLSGGCERKTERRSPLGVGGGLRVWNRGLSQGKIRTYLQRMGKTEYPRTQTLPVFGHKPFASPVQEFP